MNNILDNTLRLSVHEHLSGVIPSHAMYSSCTGLFGALVCLFSASWCSGYLTWVYVCPHSPTKPWKYGYGSIPINTIFSGMNIHLPAILMFTRGTRFWHTAIYTVNLYVPILFFKYSARRLHMDPWEIMGVSSTPNQKASTDSLLYQTVPAEALWCSTVTATRGDYQKIPLWAVRLQPSGRHPPDIHPVFAIGLSDTWCIDF